MLIQPIPAKQINIIGYKHYKISYWGGYVINTKNGKISQGFSNSQNYKRFDLRSKGARNSQYIH